MKIPSISNYFERRERQREERQAIIKKEYEDLMGYLDSQSDASLKSYIEKDAESRSVCPFCGNKELYQDIQNVNGEIHGETSGSWGLFGGSLYGHVDGKIKTDEVIHCKKCSNAWKPVKLEYSSVEDVLQSILH